MNGIDFAEIVEYIKLCPWQDDTPIESVIFQAKKAFEEMVEGKTKSKKIYRVCGQTGSGKTTQTCFAINKLLEIKNLNTIYLGVGVCAKYHPDYENIKTKHLGELREITNSFALKCMTYLLKLLIENGYMIVLDLVMLDPIYEEYVL